MELVNLNEHQAFQKSKVIKKIPIISNQLMSTILFIGPKTITPVHKHTGYDEIHYIIRGTGKIIIESESNSITEGMMILVPKSKPHNFSTSENQLTVLSVNLVPDQKMK